MTLESNPSTPRPELGGASYYEITKGHYNFNKYVDYCGGRILPGYQFRYIYFLDRSCKAKLTVPILPYSKIDEIGGRMYKGKSIGAGSASTSVPSIHEGEGGLTPTPALQ